MKRIASAFLLFIALSGSIFAADKPSFPGGEPALKKYISDNLKYPEYSKENGVEGVVGVGFIVATDGSIQNAKVIKMVDPDLEKEALRLVNGMPKWVPAEKNGTPVEAPSEVDIEFVIE